MPTILVIEDDEMLEEALRLRLIAEGFEAQIADGGETGIRMAFEFHPDLILLDLIMPGLSGSAVLRKIRQDTWGKEVPIIVLTNLPSEAKEALAKAEHVLEYYIKAETSLDTLMERIHKVIDTPI